ncbi:MAG: prolipoprotein diacylglyceryl transferase [Alphaproteobacteria bacterium]|nr:prolipoprotein diacylglyceryl transferase [Alphaproteobacteria bacterium]
MHFPNIDPVAFSIGPLAVRWYALAYLVGLIAGWKWGLALAKRDPNKLLKPELFDDFLTWAVIGVIAGGRTGYVLFYNFNEYTADPLEALRVWHGGMSFHGGMLGVILAAWIFSHVKKIPLFAFTDIVACVAPIGLGLGRIANFINGELFGRETDVPWGMVFPHGGNAPRHPSQLYEAATEGLLLLLIMALLSRSNKIRMRKGFMSGTFLALYGVFRFGIEFFREPDPQLGFLFAGATMGQLLCIPMFIAGVAIHAYSLKSPRAKSKRV